MLPFCCHENLWVIAQRITDNFLMNYIVGRSLWGLYHQEKTVIKQLRMIAILKQATGTLAIVLTNYKTYEV